MNKTVLARKKWIRTSLYILFAILLIVLPACDDVSSAQEPFANVDLHDAVTDVDDRDAADPLDKPLLSTCYFDYTTIPRPHEVLRLLFRAEEAPSLPSLTLLPFTVRPPPIL